MYVGNTAESQAVYDDVFRVGLSSVSVVDFDGLF